MDNRPIGVFDSGVGGLTVLKEMVRELPGEDIVYLGDTARVPYGIESKGTVIQYFFEAVAFLLTKNVKAVVIACNTVSALAMEEAQKEFDIPIIGVIKPGIKATVEAIKNSRIGLIATEGTIKSQAYQMGVKNLLPTSEIIAIPCPPFVSIVEEGLENTEEAYRVIQKQLSDLKDQDIDALILGCTHFPVLQPIIREILGDRVIMIDPAYETARETDRMLRELNIQSGNQDGGRWRFYASHGTAKFRRVASNILGMDTGVVKRVEIGDI